MLTLKLLLMPALIGIVTLVARRWGTTVGGWIAGLPWVAGPISVFLALEQGSPFAAQSAVQALAAVLGMLGFCRIYVAMAPRFSWPWCSLAGFAVYLGTAWMLSKIPLILAPVYAVVLLGVVLTLRSFPHPDAPPARPVPGFDLPLRMAVATGFVIAVTKAAEWLGPAWSGLLTPFPIMTSILAAFTHQQQGWQASARILRALLAAMFGFATFLLVVAWWLPGHSLWATYSLAVGITIGVNAGVFWVMRRWPAALRL
ncbi:MAG: hypothetical protein LH606_17295 [Cytophagaceae bacterium]|nr:hypothetical protein [Cytophagaceae bacterium]